jgi:RimJ/RimL family protein N-acetyltransferase
MILREAIEDDAEILARNNVLMAKESENVDIDYEFTLSGILSVLCDSNKGFYLIAEEDGVIFGQLMITYEWSDWRNHNIWWIQSVYISRDRRMNHIFRTMLEEVYRLGKIEGVKVFRLYVHSENLGAINAYKKVDMSQKKYLVFEKSFL